METDDEPSSPLALSRTRAAELIIEHARDYAFFTLDLEGRITSWSPGAARITGYSAKEAVGMSFSVIYTPPDLLAGHDRLEIETAWRDGRVEDTRWHVRKGGERFWANGVTVSLRDAGENALIKVMRDETSSRLAEEQRILLLNELNHRINNTLVTVQSVIEQTLRSRNVEGATRASLSDRLLALARAHRVLVEQNWAGADFAVVVERALAPFDPERRRFVADGPDVRLSPQQAVSVSLVLHELATNAVKYGALSTLTGRVRVLWNNNLDGEGGRHMTLLWEETGGPPVTAPQRSGFGTRLIERSLAQEDGASARIDYDPAGVRCVIELPLSSRAELPPLDIAAIAGRQVG